MKKHKLFQFGKKKFDDHVDISQLSDTEIAHPDLIFNKNQNSKPVEILTEIPNVEEESK